MATARAIASGNWSATSTWNGGVLPGNGDTVYANSFTVTIDQNVDIGGANNPIVNAGSFVSGQWYEITSVGTTSFTGIGASANTVGIVFQATGAGSGTGQARARATLTTATNTAAGATTGGGGFTLSTSYDVNADIRAAATSCINVTATSGTINLTGSNLIAGTTAGANAITNSNTAIISANGCNISGNGTPGVAFQNVAAGTINIVGCNITTRDYVSGAYTTYAILNSATGIINISNSTISSASVNNQGHTILNASGGTVSITNSTFSSNSSSFFPLTNSSNGSIIISNSNLTAGTGVVVMNSSTGSVTCTNCTMTAINGVAAISSTNSSATNRISGTFISSTNGTQPINATRWILNSSPTASYIQHALDGINANSFVRYFTADNSLGQANPTDVRSGVSYASGALTGRLTVPIVGTVSYGVNVGPSMPFTATRTGTTATATLAYSYPYQVGDAITVTGASNPEWNGSYTIASVISGTSITFTVPSTYSANSGTGSQMQTTGTGVLTVSDVTTVVNSAITSATTSIINPNVTSTINSTVPTAVNTAMDAQWNKQTSTLTVSGSIGERLKNSATVQSTGNQLASLL